VVEPDGQDLFGKRRYKRYTYRQLSADAEAVAPGLREMGVEEGTRTVFMAPPSYEACVIGLALTRVGAMTVWIDPAVGYRNVGERLRRIKPQAFVGVPIAHLGRLTFGWGPRTLRKLIVVGKPGFPGAQNVESLRRKAPADPKPPAVSPDDPVAILYTTGSTGPAKPTLYLHRNFSRLYRMVHESWRFGSSNEVPVDMPVFPAFFFIALSAGGTVVVPPINFVYQSPATADPKALLEVINDCGVKSMFGSPVLLENLARYALEHGVKAPSLQRVIGGGAPIFASVIQPFLEMMGPEGEIFSNYGATEALPSTEMGGRETLAETWAKTQQGAGMCVGRPLPGVEVKVLRMVDGPIASLKETEELARGKIGEIVVRSPHVSPSYFWDEESTRKNKIPDGKGGVWHRVGDVGYLDAEGRLWYCGRVSQRVKAKDGPLFSLQCEPIFDAHPKVRRSGLVGVSDGNAEIPVICVEVKPGFSRWDLPGLRAELLALAAKYPETRAIRHVLFHHSLPVDPRHNSKIERPAL
ncbi:MAG: fatty acid CoA ligase family protein, partial [Bdellovibrionota bacterium]